jgi:hypothetical protein
LAGTLDQKNRQGAYTGIKESILVVRGDRVVASASPEPGHYECGLITTTMRNTRLSRRSNRQHHVRRVAELTKASAIASGRDFYMELLLELKMQQPN